MKRRTREPGETRATFGALAIACIAVGVSLTAAQLAAQDVDEMRAVAKGKASYGRYCKSCHGEQGKGDGKVAEMLTVRPADLTAITSRNGGEFPFDEVFKTIDGRKEVAGHGSSDMPIWGKVFQEGTDNPDEQVIEKVAALTYYVKSIQAESE